MTEFFLYIAHLILDVFLTMCAAVVGIMTARTAFRLWCEFRDLLK